jgi:arginase
VVWFDAHGDVQTLETTASGFVGGFALRMLLGYRPEWVASRLGLRPVPEHQVVLAGARDLDPPEVAYLESSGIRRAEVVHLDAAALPDGPLYVHLDLDVVDPIGVPGLRYPAPGGPNCAQVTAALGMLLATGRVVAVGIACTWHPGHDAAAAVGDRLESVLAAGQ